MKSSWSSALAAAAALLVVVAPLRAQAGDPAAALLDGVEHIAAPGTPSPIAVWSGMAHAILVGNAGKELRAPAVVAGLAGAGRFVALPHHGYFSGAALEKGQTNRFLVNATRWVAGEKASPRVAARGDELIASLKEAGFAVRPLGAKPLAEELAEVDVLCGLSSEMLDADLEPLARFVRAGGGIVAGQCAWSWQQSASAASLDANPLNRLFGRFGVAWTGGFLGKVGEVGFASERTPPKLVHGEAALDYLVGHRDPATVKNERPMLQATATAMALLPVLPLDDKLARPRLEEWLRDHGDEIVLTPERPLRALDGAYRTLLAFALTEAERRPARDVKPLAVAKSFPGVVPPGAPRVTRAVAIDTTLPRWRSTGLYAGPGEVVTVTVPAGRGVESAGLVLQIGAHPDQLFEQDEWKRVPKAVRRVPIDAPRIEAASPVGGLLYVVVPFDCTLGTIEVEIENALEAPRFVLDRDTDLAWVTQLRHRSAPWAELASSKGIVTVPSAAVHGLETPSQLLRAWDRVLDSAAELVALPKARKSPERIVVDVQVATEAPSAYPAIALEEQVAHVIDPARPDPDWRLLFQIGRAHQDESWAIPGEVPAGLVALHAIETALGATPDAASAWFARLEAARARVAAHLAADASFEEWRTDPFLALQMHVQLREAFGWDLFKKVFREYRGLPRRDVPKTEESRLDLWMVSLSRAAQRNLGPFFTRWGVPTSEAARKAVAELPEWMPEGFPPH